MHLVRLEEAQELRLQVGADLRDFVEEQRAAGGRADDAVERRVGAGECAPAVPEQLAFEHLSGDRGAVEWNERLLRAPGRAMDRAREHFLAGARFAGEQHGDVGRRNAARDRQQLGHLLGHPEAAVGLEGAGGPEGGALLFVAPIAVEGDGGLGQLADGDGVAAVGEGGFDVGDDLPRLVAVGAADDAEAAVGVRRGAGGFVSGPPARRDDPHAVVPAGDDGRGVGGRGGLEERVRLPRQNVRIARQLDQRDRVIERGNAACIGIRQV